MWIGSSTASGHYQSKLAAPFARSFYPRNPQPQSDQVWYHKYSGNAVCPDSRSLEASREILNSLPHLTLLSSLATVELDIGSDDQWTGASMGQVPFLKEGI